MKPFSKLLCLSLVLATALCNADNSVDEGTPGIQFRGEDNGIIENLFNILCKTEHHGFVYGKMTEDGDAFYSMNSIEYECDDFSVVEGELIANEGGIPTDCGEHAKAQGDGNVYYPVVVNSKHGKIPGKAIDNETGYFGYEGKQYSRKDFDWYC